MTKEQAFDLVFHVHEDGGVKSTITDFTVGVKNETFTDENYLAYLCLFTGVCRAMDAVFLVERIGQVRV